MTGFLSEFVDLLTDWRVIAAALVTAVAGLMRGYSGFGTAILLAPAYSTLWGPRIGIPVMLMMELFVSMQLLPKAFGQADRRVMLPIGAAAICFTPLGAWVLITADQEVLRRAIGLLVLVFGFALMSGWRYHGSRPLPLNLAVGTVAGLLKGAVGVSGPPVILYLLAGPEEAKRHRANLILFFACIAVVSVIPPIWAGLVGQREIAKLVLLLPILLACVPIGARLFHVVPERWYRRFAFGLLVSTGAVALLA
ncbi:sulfite exporter TauE/SafE family protein [Falsiroseomonas sp. HW251]|uniref:sulfite exporter TauE/SafE family protein n=1 Tax=Falsiroseomonas sp. HW251 TaxID=3390998 RepID=UPI003D316BA4